jgi:hypothetical protein
MAGRFYSPPIASSFSSTSATPVRITLSSSLKSRLPFSKKLFCKSHRRCLPDGEDQSPPETRTETDTATPGAGAAGF